MCILTAEEIEHQHGLKVNNTNIFARHTRPGYQVIAYSMSIASRTNMAMILPLPVVSGSGEDALRFIDLSGYPDFFIDISRACKQEGQLISFDDSGNSEPKEVLVVHEVGDYEASYVPTIADFDRLSPCFRLADKIWKDMPDYSEYGFAVFQLKTVLSSEADEIENTIHPMAFEFPTCNSKKLFYPTVHVHDGGYHKRAGFFHTIYCQRDNARSEFKYQWDLLHGENPTPAEYFDGLSFEGYEWYFSSNDIASKSIEIDKCQGIVNPQKKLYGMFLMGQYPNYDIWLGETS